MCKDQKKMERTSHIDFWRAEQVKSPGVGACSVCSGDHREASVVGWRGVNEARRALM